MHYVCCPTRTDDLNWIDWYVVGHSDPLKLEEGVLAAIVATAVYDEEASWDDDSIKWNAIVKVLESNGYAVFKSKLNWGLCAD